MNKAAVNQYLIQSAAFYWGQSHWPNALVVQHFQLDLEIEAIKTVRPLGNCLNWGGESIKPHQPIVVQVKEAGESKCRGKNHHRQPL